MPSVRDWGMIPDLNEFPNSQRGPCPGNSAKFFELLRESGSRSGRPMTGVEGFKAKMEAAGFQDIEEVYMH